MSGCDPVGLARLEAAECRRKADAHDDPEVRAFYRRWAQEWDRFGNERKQRSSGEDITVIERRKPG
jgi:hypothetical protein